MIACFPCSRWSRRQRSATIRTPSGSAAIPGYEVQGSAPFQLRCQLGFSGLAREISGTRSLVSVFSVHFLASDQRASASQSQGFGLSAFSIISINQLISPTGTELSQPCWLESCHDQRGLTFPGSVGIGRFFFFDFLVLFSFSIICFFGW